ncbi:MAG: ABC transporter substrate-binding protein [Alphaproteobacteria bacterium]|nr:ABC transporter substrate-binding protein [Alphaproteobacteria bacterium]
MSDATITRRAALGAGATTLLLRSGGATLPLAISGASRAQGLRKERWMAPSRITLLQGYVFVGQEKGFFKDEGLDIEIQQSPGTASSLTQVAAGTSTFGQAAAVTTCPPIADENASLITIGQLAYKGFFELASLPGKPLKHPRDWQGKTIGIMSVGGTTDRLLDAMSIMTGEDPTKVKKVVTGLGPSGVAFLQRGDVDGFWVFYETRVALEMQGVQLNYLSGDSFAQLPGDSVIASTAVVQNPANEKMLVSFLRASARASAYALDPKNELETIQLLGKYNAVEGREVEKGKRILQLVRGYLAPPAGVKAIVNDEKQWVAGIELMEKIGMIKNKGLPRDRYFTNRFANQAVG